ncbi:MAG: hypothetical protein ACP5RP_02105 [Candidatus Micrarchaeia archaeon]
MTPPKKLLVRYKNSANKSNIANKGKNTSKVVANKSASAKGTGIKAKSGKKQAKSSSKGNIKKAAGISKAKIKLSPKVIKDIETLKKNSIRKDKKEKKIKERHNSVPEAAEARKVIATIMENENAIRYLQKNMGKEATDVLKMLETPKTDDYISEKLNIKINTVRKILNRAEEYGLTSYFVSKNSGGWLSFSWYINSKKANEFFDYIKAANNVQEWYIKDTNDYFICEKCYEKNKFVMTFDAAYENKFKCNICGSSLVHKTKEEIQNLQQGNN